MPACAQPSRAWTADADDGHCGLWQGCYIFPQDAGASSHIEKGYTSAQPQWCVTLGGLTSKTGQTLTDRL